MNTAKQHEPEGLPTPIVPASRHALMEVQDLHIRFDVASPGLSGLFKRQKKAVLQAVRGISFTVYQGKPSAWSASRVAANPPSPARSPGCIRQAKAAFTMRGGH
ncbi:hypothetical protein [Ewingella americana]|uniref:hypothetical protein n=1 Tax=Ewingella americana TaxID=41202 RepID=UPI001F4F3062|nr:hypothetical protein [Ewingella americana]